MAEFCDGAGNCPADAFQPSSFECRALTGECDQAENCTGSSAACPPDAFTPDDTPCTPDMNECTDDVCASGVCTHPNSMMGADCGDDEETACDNPDTCDGNGNCRPNYEPMTTECRPSAAVCDAAENCTGMSASCPPDGFATAGNPSGYVGFGDPREGLARIVQLYKAWDTAEPRRGHADQAAEWRERLDELQTDVEARSNGD